MKSEDIEIIKNELSPLLERGEASLLLGAGFAYENISTKHGRIPDGWGLTKDLLARCGQTPGKKTSLKDAYQYAKRNDPDFESYFIERFIVDSVDSWQTKIFQYAWNRIYTTNIDNVLNVALSNAIRAGKISGEYKFFNYIDEGLVSNTIGTIPIITIHGTCLALDDGFVFSSLEYAKAASKVFDWHNDLAARMIAGGLIVVGNQLDESDFDTYLARRENLYGLTIGNKNWIVMPDPDPIKAENYRAAGFHVFDATAEQFFKAIFDAVKPKSVGDIFLDKIPGTKKASLAIGAMTWFKGAFALVVDEIERAQSEKGILRHFLTGLDPDWFYIVQKAHAETQVASDLTAQLLYTINSNSTGIGILHVTGPSGAGKTTAIRSALVEVSRTIPYIYEFKPSQDMDEDFLRAVVEGFTGKCIFVFYSAADYYFAIQNIADRLKDRNKPFCLFILEDRSNDYQKAKRHLYGAGVIPTHFQFTGLQSKDAENIAQKMEDAGLKFELFSEFPLTHRARIIMDKERGFGGDLLSTMFSLTTHENFEKKIYQDYTSAGSGLAVQLLDLVAIVNSCGHDIPIDWLAGALNEKVATLSQTITEDLAGVLIVPPGSSIARCRHRIIASYYLENCIGGHGRGESIANLLQYLSRQFTVEDIKHHPLAYRIYRDLITFNFLYDKYFPKNTRDADTEQLYHEMQRFYGKDGIFWLQFGRYYRIVGRLEEAIDCFKTGLEFYESFQTKHALGMTLLELYLNDPSRPKEAYNEGVAWLEGERTRRGTIDPYPTTTLLDLLLKISNIEPTNSDAEERIKDCINKGLKHFRNDEMFMQLSRKAMTRNITTKLNKA